jgi:hypothetical protein
MSEGKYPQSPLFGKTGDGHRYRISVGLYCEHCGWPADDLALYSEKQVCSRCDTVLMEAAALLKWHRRAARYIANPYVLGLHLAAEIAGIELGRAALVRNARQMAEARA